MTLWLMAVLMICDPKMAECHQSGSEWAQPQSGKSFPEDEKNMVESVTGSQEHIEEHDDQIESESGISQHIREDPTFSSVWVKPKS